MMNRSFQLGRLAGVGALSCAALLGCWPSPRPPSAPPPELSPPARAERPVELPEGPSLPEIPPAPMGPRGPNELVLPVSDEVSAEALGALSRAADSAPRLNLVLRPCTFYPAEDAAVETAGADHCRRANQVSFGERSQQALVISPGWWEIAVQNDAFERELGFWLRPEDAPAEPIVSGGGIASGEVRVWTVELAPGRYVYSCPLSPTPDYLLVVR